MTGSTLIAHRRAEETRGRAVLAMLEVGVDVRVTDGALGLIDTSAQTATAKVGDQDVVFPITVSYANERQPLSAARSTRTTTRTRRAPTRPR